MSASRLGKRASVHDKQNFDFSLCLARDIRPELQLSARFRCDTEAALQASPRGHLHTQICSGPCMMTQVFDDAERFNASILSIFKRLLHFLKDLNLVRQKNYNFF